MNVCSRYFVGVIVLGLLWGMPSPAAAGGYTPWATYGVEGAHNSLQLGFQVRFGRPSAEVSEAECKLCRLYGEALVEWNDLDDRGRKRDVDAEALGLRYYLLSGGEEWNRVKNLALFAKAGLSRVRVEDLAKNRLGSYGGLGLQYPISRRFRKATNTNADLYPRGCALRRTWFNALVDVTYNQIDVGPRDVDYLSVKYGFKLVIATKADRTRAALHTERDQDGVCRDMTATEEPGSSGGPESSR